LPLYLELADFEAAPEILEKVKEQAQSQQQAQAPKSLQEGQSV
jgi:FimV-like protein